VSAIMKVLVLLALVAVASSSTLRGHSGWRTGKVRDMSKFKSLDMNVTPNPHNIRTLLRNLIHKNKPVTQVLPHTKSFADVCGQMGNEASTHIVGGSEARKHQYPWQVGLFIDGLYFCGGSIISDEYILTAAHCADGFSFWDVVIGAHEVKNPAEEGHLEFTTRKAFVHPQWDSFNLANDIAILKVDKITFNKYVSPICLPAQSEVGETFVGDVMTVSGWGRESDSSSGIARFLNHVDVPVITNKECNDIYGIVGAGVVCVSTEGGKGTCNGDSGGPLVMKQAQGTAYNQYGVVSFGASLGCEAELPAGFSRVTEYLKFIADTTGIVIP
jgi:secreted trypsin-like serine protease